MGSSLLKGKFFKHVAEEVGLKPLRIDGSNFAFARHPLAFLMEAADDVCNRFIDLEDGFRIERIPFSEAEEKLLIIAKSDERFKPDEYSAIDDDKLKISYLRSKCINYLTHQCWKVFEKNYDQILDFEFDTSLLDVIDDQDALSAIEELYQLVKKYIYQWGEVVALEASGFEILSGLVSEFVLASDLCIDCDDSVKSRRAMKINDILPNQFRPLSDEESYYKYLKVASYVSGMTDSYALSLFRKIRGIQNLSR